MGCGLAAGKGRECSLKGEAIVRIVCWEDEELRTREDSVAVEEPLEVYVDGTLSLVTMRTPGQERELAAGYCLSEGVIDSLRDIGAVGYCGEENGNRVDVLLAPARKAAGRAAPKQRSELVYSSCGICGKDLVDAVSPRLVRRASTLAIRARAAGEMLRAVESCQEHFGKTGGTHAAGLFGRDMELLAFAEDIGRHNALDKAMGEVVLGKRLDEVMVVVLTSRLSYEMVLKAGRTRAELLIGMSSPTSLGIEMARRMNLTVLGFARQGRFNVYNGVDRVTE
jgi:FdhD protein